MVVAIWDLGRNPSPDAYNVNVIGQRYTWQFEYPDLQDAEGNTITTFNEAHIPAGREVAFHLRSIDVIHSFWVPKLGGKLDVIPCVVVTPAPGLPTLAVTPTPNPSGIPDCIGGGINTLWLKSDAPGTFSGQCAEFCGLSHALMKLVIHADSPADFAAWQKEMTSGAPSASGSATGTPAPSGTGAAASPTPNPTATPVPSASGR
jgi:cytochrome c oxidase subunit 2